MAQRGRATMVLIDVPLFDGDMSDDDPEAADSDEESFRERMRRLIEEDREVLDELTCTSDSDQALRTSSAPCPGG